MTETAAVVALEVAAESGGGSPEPLHTRTGDARFYPDDDPMWIDAETGSYAAHRDRRRC